VRKTINGHVVGLSFRCVALKDFGMRVAVTSLQVIDSFSLMMAFIGPA